jgi:ABC-type nitrate/sulfonate/bicarbonate transport system permease component
LAAVATTTRTSARRRLPDAALPWLGVLVVLVVFELVPRVGLIDRHYFPPVSDMLSALVDQLGTTHFWTAVGQTMEGWALGLGIASAVAIPVGIVVGSSALAYRALRAVIEFLRPIPSVALIPLAVLVWGTGFDSKLFLVVYASFWPVLIQTLYGVRDVDPVLHDTARSYRLGRLARLRWVTLPTTLPYVATGVRISSSVALILAVTAELVIGSPGLGAAITLANANGNVRLMYALIIATGLLGWALNILLTQAERRALHWHPSQRVVR